MKTPLNHFITLVSITIFLIIILIINGCYNQLPSVKEAQNQFSCGVVYPEDYLDEPSNANYHKGKNLFKDNCASCHAKNMVTHSTGPALANVQERWADYPREDLYRWIRNSTEMIESNHPKAKNVWEEWQPTVMTSFPNLTNEEIEYILEYIDTAQRVYY